MIRGGYLYEAECRSVADAHMRFGREKGLMVLRPHPMFACCRITSWYFTVPEGTYALVQRFGADQKTSDDSFVWGPGVHIMPPWYNVSHLITKQCILYPMPVKEARTKDNVSVEVDCEIVLRIMGDEKEGEKSELVNKFVHELSPRGLEAQLIAAQQEAVRTLTRRLKHTQVYALLSSTERASKKQALVQQAMVMDRGEEGAAPAAAIAAPRGAGGKIAPESPTANGGEETKENLEEPLLGEGGGESKEGGTGRRTSSKKIVPIDGSPPPPGGAAGRKESGLGPLLGGPGGGGGEQPSLQFSTDTEESGGGGGGPARPGREEGGEGEGEEEGSGEESEGELAALVGAHDAAEVRRAAAARRRAARAVDAMLVELNRQFMPQGVQVLDVIITRVLLPPEIQQQMSNKTFIISENAQQRMNQKWEMQRLEHEEEMTTLRQEQAEEQMEESSKGTHSVQLLQKELDVKGADMQRAKKKVLEDGHIKAQMVVAEAEAQAAKLRVEADNILAILKAESQKVAAVSQSETTKFVETRLGEAALQAAKNHAKAAEILNDGEEKVSEMLEAKREHELRELRVGVYHALAGNEKTIITDGADASKANHMLITEAILAGDGGGGGFAGSGAAGGGGRARVLAELAVLKNAQRMFLADNDPPAAAAAAGGVGAVVAR